MDRAKGRWESGIASELSESSARLCSTGATAGLEWCSKGRGLEAPLCPAAKCTSGATSEVSSSVCSWTVLAGVTLEAGP
eukprot:6478294-Amphidinium_carterae.2